MIYQCKLLLSSSAQSQFQDSYEDEYLPLHQAPDRYSHIWKAKPVSNLLLKKYKTLASNRQALVCATTEMTSSIPYVQQHSCIREQFQVSPLTFYKIPQHDKSVGTAASQVTRYCFRNQFLPVSITQKLFPGKHTGKHITTVSNTKSQESLKSKRVMILLVFLLPVFSQIKVIKH